MNGLIGGEISKAKIMGWITALFAEIALLTGFTPPLGWEVWIPIVGGLLWVFMRGEGENS